MTNVLLCVPTLLLLSLLCRTEQVSDESLLLRQAIETVVLPAKYARCSNVDIQNEYQTCQILDSSDVHHLACQGLQECIERQSSVTHQPCPDGSVSRTCCWLDKDSEEYVCACHSARRAFGGEGSDQFAWLGDWRPDLPVRLDQGDVFHRRLCHQPSGEDLCLVQEKVHLRYLLVYLNISEESMSASSFWSWDGRFHYRRVILGRYTDPACAWVPDDSDDAPWIQFDMGREVTVWGIILKERCDYGPQKVTTFTLKSSHDLNTWTTAAENMAATYPDGATALCWLSQQIKGRYWKFFPLTWIVLPAMKADLIGLV